MKRMLLVLTSSFLFLALVACAQGKEAKSELDYDQTKKMIVDILKTDQGKKAIQDVLTDEKMKQALILDETVVKKTIEDAMVSDKGQQFWEKLFKDPEFSSKFAKSMGKEQTTLMKTLLKDPEYQAGVIEIMKNPEVEKMMLQTMKSKEYRQYLQQVLTETAESPLFQAKMIDIISKGVQKAEKSGSDKKEAGGEGGSQGGKKEQQ
ncbi:spore gernimation protein GerD [Bacillus cereus]|uniref:spore germination protein GerD n=1 Tax=Bacillus TaxID=1386 RepID=UPI00077A18AE|nr:MULTISPECIES: spore germination protein GerD [Bacillus cereus group]KXY80549.1 spore gernimation protein GerD [Bacillus wiedmannii]MED0940474.1 spore germination protein GerD [Bacillus mobilis]MED0949285.1 spore germination protein GerD [Bacillus mobilis]MED1001936.1 spore germination protein GerD [Bacillus mobilis]PDZ02470.1 spore gernimation protein GerD [Bacillus cereus]